MMRARVFREEIKKNEKLFRAFRVETKNADLVMLSEEVDQLGTLAIAIPQTQKMLNRPISSVLLGDRNVMIARMLAERLAQKTGKIALASVFAKSPIEREIGAIFVKLFEKVLKSKKITRAYTQE